MRSLVSDYSTSSYTRNGSQSFTEQVELKKLCEFPLHLVAIRYARVNIISITNKIKHLILSHIIPVSVSLPLTLKVSPSIFPCLPQSFSFSLTFTSLFGEMMLFLCLMLAVKCSTLDMLGKTHTIEVHSQPTHIS